MSSLFLHIKSLSKYVELAKIQEGFRMAVSERTELGYFKKGSSGNAKGRPKLMPYEVIELQDMAKVEVITAINATMLMTREELKKTSEDPAASLAQLLVGSIIQKAIKEGCFSRAQFLVNYVLGRPKMFDLESADDDAPSVQKVLKGVPSSILLEMVKSGRNSAAVE
jgi:hypothetical protein